MTLAEGLLNPELQYGAFALCLVLVGLLVYLLKMTREERGSMGERLDKKDAQMLAHVERSNKVTADLGSAVDKLAEALEARPCLNRDRVFNHKADLVGTEDPH